MTRRRGRKPHVVDTNVPVVANRRHGESYACPNACTQALLRVKNSGVLLIDDRDRILAKYRSNASLSGQPGVGDSFIRWVHDNQGRRDLVLPVRVTPRSGDREDYEEFPPHPALATFDPSDRKFVAVALCHGGNPPILNATDSDWWRHKDALAEAGVKVRFLCPEHFNSRVTTSKRR